MDRILLTGIGAEILGYILTILFGVLSIDVPLVGFEDQIVTIGEALKIGGLVLLFFSDKVKESAKAYIAFRKESKIKKRNWS